jgi:hypothetical protein
MDSEAKATETTPLSQKELSLVTYVDPVPLRAPLSTAVQADPATGKIPWNEALMLIPHEFIRVEMLRVTRVVQFLACDCALPPGKRWRVQRFHTYMIGWFRPMIIDHHEVEERICVPHVQALGEDLSKLESGRTDEGLVKDHEELLAMLEAFCNEHVAPLAAVSSPTEDISGRVAGTIKAWVELNTELLEHLAVEEVTWPKVFQSIGHEQTMLMLNKIEAHNQKGDGRAFAAIVQSLGLPIAGSRVDEGWATGGCMDDPHCQALIAGFSGIPWPVRNLCCILPRFVAQYEHLTRSLVSIATMTDDAHDIGSAPTCGPCCCVVS